MVGVREILQCLGVLGMGVVFMPFSIWFKMFWAAERAKEYPCINGFVIFREEVSHLQFEDTLLVLDMEVDVFLKLNIVEWQS